MSIVQSIYEAAFDKSKFSNLLEIIVKQLGAKSAFFAWSDAEKRGDFHAQFGNDPQWLELYFNTYAQHDILHPILADLPEGVCKCVHPFLQTEAVRNSVFFREYLQPQGIIDNLAVNLLKRHGLMAHLALLRSAPAEPFSIAEVAALNELVPHLQRAIYIQSRLIHDANSAAGYREGLAGTAGHVMLISEGGCVEEVDPELGALLNIRAGDTLARSGVGAVVEQCIAQAEPVGFLQPQEDGSDLPLLLEARPLNHDRFGDLVASFAASHVVHVTIIDRSPRIAFAAIAAMFRLTPTELRVMRDAIEHGDLVGIGERMGMARATARTHLHRIYEKTQTSGFAALSNLAHRFTHTWSKQR